MVKRMLVDLLEKVEQKFQNPIAKEVFLPTLAAGGIVGNSKSGATRAKNFTSTTVSATTGSLIGPIAGTHDGSFNGYANFWDSSVANYTISGGNNIDFGKTRQQLKVRPPIQIQMFGILLIFGCSQEMLMKVSHL